MSDFLCPFPWVSPCVMTDGHFRVCPVSQSALSKGYVKNLDGVKPSIENIENINEAINADSLKTLRKKMRDGGDVSDTCQRCLYEESRGLRSRRLLELDRFPEFNRQSIERLTENDGSLKSPPHLSAVVLRMGNKCNLVCRMCSPSSSNAWYKEWKETTHSGFQEDGTRIGLKTLESGAVLAEPNPYSWAETDSAVRFIEKCGSSLTRIHFSGGEPLLSRGHLQVLRYLTDTRISSQISLEYNSNLTVLSEEILKLWSQFKHVEMGISIDGPPTINEYIRYPINSDRLISNLKKIDEAPIHARLWIATTVQIYNLLSLDDLEIWLQEQKFSRIKSQVSWHILRAPNEMSIYALPANAKEKAAKELSTSKSFSKLANLIFDLDYSHHFPDFIKSTNLMDAYRGQSIRQLNKLWPLIQDDYLCRS